MGKNGEYTQFRMKAVRFLAVFVGILAGYILISESARASAADVVAAARYVDSQDNEQLRGQFDSFIAGGWPSDAELQRFVPKER